MPDTEEVGNLAVTTPITPGDAPLPQRNGRKSLLPLSWVGREVTVEYTDAGGEARATSATILDLYPFGLILNVRGTRTALAWERVALIELAGS
jgi:hypothetical protein